MELLPTHPVPEFKSPSVSPVSSEIGTRIEYIAADAIPTMSVYTHMHVVDSALRRGDQFSGSSGSFEGAGTRTMSFWPLRACFVRIAPSRSTRWTVPGMDWWPSWRGSDIGSELR